MIDRISSANVQSMLEVLRSYQSQAAGGAGATTEPTATKVGQPTFLIPLKTRWMVLTTHSRNRLRCPMHLTVAKKCPSPKWC